ncbi:uncharacterized protein LOC110242966 [Exaiptasia diaphana]|uniref:Uncharacterized protein n=1 Tax=Exaiptasia diaphana TaxID=2652724 RepID=A0A913XH36_EXADI|nr:uncharacterized protein LOC110242966 [Exaiptasia diaphana]
MSVYNKHSPMNDILVRGEEARRRRSKKRRLQPDEITVDPSVRLRPHEHVVQETPHSNWFLEMISYPRQKQLSMLESFTAISALSIYFPLNVFVLLYPVQSCSLIDNKWTPEQCFQAKGFIRITGIQAWCIFFLLVILSRASSRLPLTGTVLGSVLSRTVYAISAGYLLYIRKYISLNVLFQIIALDCGLALISVVIWVSYAPIK